MSTQTTEKFDLWAVVELFGHTKIAGRCTEQNIAGGNMLRVDVPETKSQPAFTRFFGSAAIYAINPMDEASVLIIVEKLQQAPINSYDVSAVMKKHRELLLEKPSPAGVTEPGEDYPKGPHEDDDADDDWGA